MTIGVKRDVASFDKIIPSTSRADRMNTEADLAVRVAAFDPEIMWPVVCSCWTSGGGGAGAGGGKKNDPPDEGLF